MPIFPYYVGQTDPAWQFTCYSVSAAGAQTVVNLTGYTITVRIAPAPASGDPVFATGGGTIDTTNLATGVVKYTPNGAEFAASGTYIVQVKAVNGANVKEFDYIYGPVYKGA